jgi:NitT/TauT family transport system substrate-binding protein
MRRVCSGLAVLAACAALAACGSDEPSGATSQAEGGAKVTKITIGTVPHVNLAPAWIAMDEGILARHGLQASGDAAAGSAAALPSLLQGSVQFIPLNTASLVTAASKGVPVKALAPIVVGPDSEEQPNSPLAVLRNGPIESLRDLAGKTIAVNLLRNIGELTTRETLERAGVDTTTVKFVAIEFPEMLASLKKGRVDAVVTAEPFWSAMKADGARMLADTFLALKPRLGTGFWVTTDRYLTEHPDVVKRFTAAIQEANGYAAAHPDAVRAAVAKHTETPSAVAERMVLPAFSTQIDKPSIDLFAQIAKRFGVIDRPVDVNALFADQAR